ncbi:MAG TPA: malonyl-CoA decarboxylase family protein, partial [Alphaproteobacteria bacterium]|nr:malonyl-CoA decarboxylase family protein [Alphaproteobacteria bacterium]
TNGARLERINWMADHSANGMRQSLGMMVNYLYRLGDIEKNHEAYTGNGRVVASTAVQRLGKF